MSDATPDADLPEPILAEPGHSAAAELPEPFADPPEMPELDLPAEPQLTGFAKFKPHLQMAGVFLACLYVVGTTTALITRPTQTTAAAAPRPATKSTQSTITVAVPKLDDADSRLKASDYGEALRMYQEIQAAQSGAEAVDMLYRIGLCFEALGDFEKAIDQYREMVEGDTTDQIRWVSRVSQARAWLRSKKPDRARQLLAGLILEGSSKVGDDHPAHAEAAFLFALASPHFDTPQTQDPGEPPLARAPTAWPVEDTIDWADKQPATNTKTAAKPRTNERENAVSDLPIARITEIASAEYTVADLLAEISKAGKYDLKLSSAVSTQFSERRLSVGQKGIPLAIWLSAVSSAVDCRWEINNGELIVEPVRLSVPKVETMDMNALDSAHGVVGELALRLALDWSPTHRLFPTARMHVGNLYYHRKQYAVAMVEYQELLKTSVSTTSLAATYNIGLVLQKMGRFEGAREALYRVVDGNPESSMASVASYLIGRMLLDEGQHADAVPALEFAARAKMPDDSRAAAAVYAAIAHLLGDNYHEAGSILFATRSSFLKTHSLRDAAAFLNSYARYQMLEGNAELQRRETVYLFRSLFALGSDATWLGSYGMLLVGRAYRDLGMKAQMSRIFERSLADGATGITAAEMRFLLLEARLDKEETSAAARDEMLRFSVAEFENKWGQRARLTIARMDYTKRRFEDCLTGCRELVNAPHIQSFELLRLMGQAYDALNQHRNAALCFDGQIPPQS